MQDLKYFVDIVESVHSGGSSLFGLRNRKQEHKSGDGMFRVYEPTKRLQEHLSVHEISEVIP